MRTLLVLLAVSFCADATPLTSAAAYCPNGAIVGPSSAYCRWEDSESAFAKAYFDYHGWYPGGDAISGARLSAVDNVLSAVSLAAVSASYGLLSSGWSAYASYDATARTSGRARAGIVKFKASWSAHSGTGVDAAVGFAGGVWTSPLSCPDGFGVAGFGVYSCEWQRTISLGESSPFLVSGRSFLTDTSVWQPYGPLGQLKQAAAEFEASFFEADGVTPVGVSFYAPDEVPTPAPEPPAVFLIGAGLAVLAVKRRLSRPSPGVESA